MTWEDAPKTLGPNENFFATPIFILNFNRLGYLQKLLSWLLSSGYRNICIIDSHSTYGPLLQFYSELVSNPTIKVVRLIRNVGKDALWHESLLERFGVTGPFVYTDSDVVPDECCPIDVVGRLASYLCTNPQIFKAGMGLRIDNLDDGYKFKKEVVIWERQFWRAPVSRGAFLASIDTTFALYRPNSTFAMEPALRTGWPYLARHEPWFQNTEARSVEHRYYALAIEQTGHGHWERQQLPGPLEAEVAERADSDLSLLHLGCGHEIIPGWINLDRSPAVGADIVFDLEMCAERTLPISTGSIDGFFMCHAFEHIDSVLPMMQELHRVAKPNARFIIRLPHGASDEAFEDPTHKRHYFPNSFIYYAQPAYSRADYDYLGDWQVKRVKLVVNPNLIESDGEQQVLERIRRERNIVEEMIVELRAVKPPRPRHPHLLEWPAPTISGTRIDTESNFMSSSIS